MTRPLPDSQQMALLRQADPEAAKMADAIAAAGAAAAIFAASMPNRTWPYKADLEGQYMHHDKPYTVSVVITITPTGDTPHDRNHPSPRV